MIKILLKNIRREIGRRPYFVMLTLLVFVYAFIYAEVATPTTKKYPPYPIVLTIPETAEGSVNNAQWCGSSAVLYYFGYLEPGDQTPKSHGTYWVNVITKERKKLKLDNRTIVWGCTPNGKWVVFQSHPDDTAKYGYGTWRYNLKTDKSEKLFNESIVNSKNEKFITHYDRSRGTLATDERLKIIKLANSYSDNGFEAVLMPDQTTILVHDRVQDRSNPSNKSPVPRYTIEDHSEKKVVTRSLDVDFPLSSLRVDKKNHIYGIYYDRNEPRDTLYLYKCRLIMNALKCEPAIHGNPNIKPGYEISLDGSYIYFQQQGNDCIWRYRVTDIKRECIAKRNFGTLLALSPEGKYLAYSKSKEPISELIVLRLY